MSLVKEIEEKIENVSAQLKQQAEAFESNRNNMHILNGALQAYNDILAGLKSKTETVKDESLTVTD